MAMPYIPYGAEVDFSELKGRIFKHIIVDRESGDDTIEFIPKDCAGPKDARFIMGHPQECCEDVYIKDIVGDIADLLHSPILTASRVVEYEKSGITWGDTETSVWYKLATIKGSVTITWYGSSNGFYSEEAALYLIKQEN